MMCALCARSSALTSVCVCACCRALLCRGYGVRALQRIKAGQFILEYVGEVIDSKELSRRMEAARSTAQHSYYIMELEGNSDHLYIDARTKGGIARLINSSCNPNCETQKWHDASSGEPRVGIFARRDIEPGEVGVMPT